MLWSHREFSPKSPKSHTPLGLRAFQPRSLLVVGDVKSLIPASFPAAAPSSWLTSVPRAAGGGLLGPSEQRLPQLKLNKEKLPIFL